MSFKALQQSRRRALGQLGLGLLATSAATVPANRSHAAPSDEPRLDGEPWTLARTQLVLNPRLAYFDCAQFAPSSRALLASHYRAQEALHTDPNSFYEQHYSTAAVRSSCQRMADWLDCQVNELCFTHSATAGLSQCVQAMPLRSGDEIIINAQLPEAQQRFWQAHAKQLGLVVKTLVLPTPLRDQDTVLAAYQNALSERSRVLVCSQVQAGDGALLPVRELCALARAQGMISVVDGSLSLGAVQLSLRELDCDVYGASVSHWLNGPQQTAIVYVRSALQAELQTDAPSAASLPFAINSDNWPALVKRWPHDFVTLAPQLLSLATALNWQDAVGRKLIEARLRELQTYTRLRVQELARLEILTPQQPGMWLHMLSLRVAQRNPMELVNWLRNNDKVIVSAYQAAPNGLNALRISLQIYNSHDEIERLIQGLQRALRV